MKLLEERILKDGVVKPGAILKVDQFLNHQIDVAFYQEIGKEFYSKFQDLGINKILTIEASGIGIACITACYFKTPVLFAKKTLSKNLDGDEYQSMVSSYTRSNEYIVRVSKKFLGPADKVLIIDDFLANGNAVLGLWDIIKQAGAQLLGVGIVIEKGFQEGGKLLRAQGLRVESLAIIEEMRENEVIFKDQAQV